MSELALALYYISPLTIELIAVIAIVMAVRP
jgi:hypothetical protein